MKGKNIVVTPHSYRAWVVWNGVYYVNDNVTEDQYEQYCDYHTVIPSAGVVWRQVRAEDVPAAVKLQLKLESAA